MSIGIMGYKLGMTRIFRTDGSAVPVTVVAAGPCPVTQIKTQDSDGYNALQLAFDEVPERKVNKPKVGHLAKSGVAPSRHLREFRLEDVSSYELGQEITVDIFELRERIRVTGTSKGKGFQGPMKRHNFHGMPASHGHEKVHRSTGSVGHATFPGKVWKGKKMAGQMGNERVTIKNAEIVDIRPEEGIILIKGNVPGPKNGLVMLRKMPGNNA